MGRTPTWQPQTDVTRTGVDVSQCLKVRVPRAVHAVIHGRTHVAGPLMGWCQDMPATHETYIREHFGDIPEIRGWTWTDI